MTDDEGQKTNDLKRLAREIFDDALRAVDAGKAVREAVEFSETENRLKIAGEVFDLTALPKIYAAAVGKAALPMAIALDDILKSKLSGGIVSGVLTNECAAILSPKWKIFAGGHPLPNEASLAAANGCFDLLKKANDENSLIIFLISGGGSAMLEMPVDENITLADLRETNRILITCGAPIAEINRVRKTLSKVKGGGLAQIAPRATQVTLIVSDTEPGDESSVASGLTFPGAEIRLADVNAIIEKYEIKLSPIVLNALKNFDVEKKVVLVKQSFHVLLDNESVTSAAAKSAAERGFGVQFAPEISRQNVSEGCRELFDKAKKFRLETSPNEKICLISGGEFSCPVRGNGIGGRNSETVLRMAEIFDESKKNFSRVAFLSAGTDGIDGNSPAAGAICDEKTLDESRTKNLDWQRYLENSDSYNFFKKLGDDLTVGATGTNVRDLRILLVG